MTFIRLFWWLEYYDDTRVRIEQEITRRCQLEAEKQVRLGELEFQKTVVMAQKEFLLKALDIYLTNRAHYFQERENFIRTALQNRAKLNEMYTTSMLKAVQENNIDFFRLSQEGLLKLQEIDPLIGFKQLEEMRSSEELQMLSAGTQKFLASS